MPIIPIEPEMSWREDERIEQADIFCFPLQYNPGTANPSFVRVIFLLPCD